MNPDEPIKPVEAPVPPASSLPPFLARPILLVGEDLAWLQSGKLLASRPVVFAEPGTDPLSLLAAQPHDLLLASYTDPRRSLALLQSAAVASPSTVGVLRAGAKELSHAASPFFVLPRVDSVEVLDDQLRTRLAAAAWQANPKAAAVLKQMVKLPTLPAIYTQITAALQSENTSLDEIADLVAREPAVSAKLLQLANSPLFGMRERVTSVRDATSLLGLSRLRSLVLATCLFRQFDPAQCGAFSMARFEESSLRIANWAATITMQETADKQMVDMAFTAGLLHNFGMLLLAVNLPGAYHLALENSRTQGIDIARSELQTFGVANSEIAGGILASWGLPFPIVNAVGWSAAPSSSEDRAFSPLTAVHTAIAIEFFGHTGMYNFDRAYIARLQFEPHLLRWSETLIKANQPLE